MPIITSKKLKKTFQDFLEVQIQLNNFQKKLEIIQIGKNLASTKYIQIKQKIGQKLGIIVNHNHFLNQPSSEIKQQIQQILKKVEENQNGLIFQLPVSLNFQNLVAKTPAVSDVDLLGRESFLLLEKGLLAPTIGAIDLVLKDIFRNLKTANNLDLLKLDLEQIQDFQKFIDFKLDLNGLNVAVIGQGRLVGQPSIKYLLDREATILALNSKTKNIQKLTKQAEIVICGAGSKDLIDRSWIQKKAIVIDASTSESDGKLTGDVNRQAIDPETILSPSPGGIGKLTVLYLFWNLLRIGKV